MTTYTRAVLQLIDENPGISAEEIDSKLGLQGRDIGSLIRPYVKSGHVIVAKERIKGQRRQRVTFLAVKETQSAAKYERRSAYTRWTTEELTVLTSLYPDHSNRSIAQRLGRTLDQIDCKASALTLHKSDTYIAKLTEAYDHWSPDEIQVLREQYGEKSTAELAELVGKSRTQVTSKARKLGLKKSNAFWQKCGEQLPRKGPEPVGTERIFNGYIHIKVRDPGVWELKQQHVWRAHHGEYNRKTYVLWFKDRNPLNCDVSNLELITRADLWNRTSIMRYPKELREVITLHTKLKRKLREQHRETT